MRLETQTHLTETGAPAVQLEDLPGVFFTGGDGVITAWAAAKHRAIPTPHEGDALIAVSDRAEDRGRELRETFERFAK